MPFCATCGSSVEGRFCAKCGAPVAAAAQPEAAPPPPPPSQGSHNPPPPGYATQPGYAAPAASAGMADSTASALCYILFAGVIFLVVAPYNQNKAVRFHAFQGLFLFVAACVIRIGALLILPAILGFWMWSAISLLLSLFFLIVWLYVFISTLQGKKVVLPIIGPFAEQQA